MRIGVGIVLDVDVPGIREVARLIYFNPILLVGGKLLQVQGHQEGFFHVHVSDHTGPADHDAVAFF